MRTTYCPYCDGDDAVIRDTVHTEINDEKRSVIVVRRALCRECRQTFYAVRTYTAPDDEYDCYRRDELKGRTGIRLKNGILGRCCQ